MKNPFQKVKFIKSPTAMYLLAYCVGEVAEMPALQAKELLDAGYVEFVGELVSKEIPDQEPEKKTRKTRATK